MLICQKLLQLKLVIPLSNGFITNTLEKSCMVRDATLCQKAVVFSRVRHKKLRITVRLPLNHDKKEVR